MKIRAGYRLAFTTYGPTPMNLLLNVRPERDSDLITPDTITFDPPIPSRRFIDTFGNVCTRIVAPGGPHHNVGGFPDRRPGSASMSTPRTRNSIRSMNCPTRSCRSCSASRYCDTDKLSQTAWSLFGNTPLGWERVQAIVDYANQRLTFDYQLRDNTRSAFEAHAAGRRVPRLRASRHHPVPLHEHPGPLRDRLPRRHRRAGRCDPMDFSAWFEAYLGGRWYTFDARHNKRPIGRIVMAHGRDAADCAMTTSFGTADLVQIRGPHRRGEGEGDQAPFRQAA